MRGGEDARSAASTAVSGRTAPVCFVNDVTIPLRLLTTGIVLMNEVMCQI
jgi:hypothetical protein